jgi:hypothetical protein
MGRNLSKDALKPALIKDFNLKHLNLFPDLFPAIGFGTQIAGYYASQSGW